MTIKLKPMRSPPPDPFTFSPSPPASPSGSPIRPPADLLPASQMTMFGARPLLGSGNEQGRELVRCSKCGKGVMRWAMGVHQQNCQHILNGASMTGKKIKLDKGPARIESDRKRPASEDSSISPPKKRSRLPVSESPAPTLNPEYQGLKKSEIKRLKKEKEKVAKREAKEAEKAAAAERKRLRASEPINLDKQCGVINDKLLPCSRSLTCKSHTVGAKRAVIGRSQPYDVLYLEWQRVNRPDKVPLPKPPKKPKPISPREPSRVRVEVDEGGKGDVEDLINLAKMAGEKVRAAARGEMVISGINMSGVNTSGIIGGGGGSGGVGVGSGSGSVGGGGMEKTKSRWSTMITEPIWKSSLDLATSQQVGEMFIKALASRTRPEPPGISGGSGGSGGSGVLGGTGQQHLSGGHGQFIGVTA
ncbi:hypothetical protein M231_02221 [Tremella mesenterica]|uniref:SCA7 domain-containing protein n=1 Tax=Tremella mesenterica TaxID=5217 RepID=A0A4Q1BRJ4_TREME|nr:hypothetical protein M231_02221 [Tremella mesenterica]